MPVKLYLYLGVGLVVAGLFAATLLFKARMETAIIKQQVAEEQRDTMYDINQQLLEKQRKDDEIRKKLYSDFREARRDAEDYRQKLAKHDLATLAAAKPATLTRLARVATKRVLAEIEAVANSEEVPVPSEGGPDKAQAASANGSRH